MAVHIVPVPDMIPVLARGKHRNPRKGACFMELVSYLAGERWSDHPGCTHPLLAKVARLVNDLTTDTGRPRLAPLIPSVIGLNGGDPRLDARIALHSATLALPVVAAGRQCAMAVSILASERVLNELDGRPAGTLHQRSRKALDDVPHASAWARDFSQGIRVPVKGFSRHAAPNTVRSAALGIAEACEGDPDDLLYAMLTGAIEECTEVAGHVPAEPRVAEWAAACELAGVVSE